jgi:hypothetical protein
MARASRFLAIALSAAGLFLVSAGKAQAIPYDWAGPVSGNYSDPLRWNPNGVPGPGDVANILLDGTYTVTLDIDAQVDNIHVGAATTGVVTFRVLPGVTLTLLAPGSNLRTNAVLDNLGGVNFAGDFAILGDPGAVPMIDNTGIVAKTAGTGGCQVPSVNFVSSGVLQIVSGSLLMTGGGSFSGVVDIASGGEIRLESGTYAVSAAFPSQGTLRLGVGSTANLTTPVTVYNYAMEAGSVLDGQGSGTLDVATYFQWAGGTVANTSLTVTPTAALDVVDNATLTNTSLQNFGVLNDSRGGNTVFAVDSSGLVNHATYNFYGAASNNVMLASGAGASIQNEGDWNVSGSGDLVISGVPFRNKGNVFVSSGTIGFGSGGGLVQTAGTIFMLGGGLGNGPNAVRGDTAVLGGALEGNGEIYGTLTNGGVVSPGSSGLSGSLLVDFDYVQLASGMVTADIESAALFDRMDVTGNVTLAGALKPFFIGGFVPAPGDRFPVLAFQQGRTGTVGLGSGTSLCLEYDALGLELVKRAVGCAFSGGVAHDSRQLRDLAALPDGSARADHFLISQQPHSSYEVVVDATSADLSAGAGPALDLVGSDGLTMLKSSLPAGAKASRSLRFENQTGSAVAEQYVRVQSNGCSTDCGPDDVYRIRSYDTTYRVPRFNNSATQVTVLLLHNPGSEAVAGNIWYWGSTGALATSQPFTVPARGAVTLNTSQSAPGQGGTITISHDGRYAALDGKAVSVEPSTGFTFDTALIPRPSSTKMVPRDN